MVHIQLFRTRLFAITFLLSLHAINKAKPLLLAYVLRITLDPSPLQDIAYGIDHWYPRFQYSTRFRHSGFSELESRIEITCVTCVVVGVA